MATQKTWNYFDALADYNRPFDNIRKMMPQWAGLDNAAIMEQVKAFDFMGESNPFGNLGPASLRSWEDILRDNAYQQVGQQAYSMTPQQLEQMAQQSGILGAKEQSFGEIAMEGITGPLALPLIFTGAGLMNGAFSGAGAAGAELGASSLGASTLPEASYLTGEAVAPWYSGANIPAAGVGEASWLSNVPAGSVMAPEAGALGASTLPEATFLTGETAAPWFTPTSNIPAGSVMAGGAAAAGSLFPGVASTVKDAVGMAGLKDLFGTLNGGMKDVFGDDWGAKAAGSLPILAAMDYAKGQSGFDTSRLESTYNEFDPSALAFEYDQNTAKGRDALTSSLTQRGVMGSSFGNNDLTNFQTSRDLGRRSLVNQGLAARGGLASSILDAQVKERALKNDLYGRSLMALGNVLGGRR